MAFRPGMAKKSRNIARGIKWFQHLNIKKLQTSQHQHGFRVSKARHGLSSVRRIDQALGCLLASGIQGNYQNVAHSMHSSTQSQSSIQCFQSLFHFFLILFQAVLWVMKVRAVLACVDFSTGPMQLAAHDEVVGLPLAPLSKLIVAELANHLKGSEVQKCW